MLETFWLYSTISLAAITGVPDAAFLRIQAESLGVPMIVALAVPTVESGRNLNPLLKGANGDIGRFQVRAAVWGRAFGGECARLAVYRNNVRCGLLVLRWCFARYGTWPDAVSCYNGTGSKTRIYLAKVERAAGKIALRIAAFPGGLAWPISPDSSGFPPPSLLAP